MKKIYVLLLLIFLEYFSTQILYAQNNSTSDNTTSNQESDINLTPQQLSQVNAEMEPLPDSPGVEVAPPPNRIFSTEQDATSSTTD